MREDFLSTRIRRHRLDPADRGRLVALMTEALAGEPVTVFAYLFGSFLTDGPFADVDTGVFLDPNERPSGVSLDAQLDLTARLETALRIPVDIVILNDASLGLRVAAIRGRVIYSRDEVRRLAFAEQTALQAMDMAYLHRRSLEDLLQTRSIYEGDL